MQPNRIVFLAFFFTFLTIENINRQKENTTRLLLEKGAYFDRPLGRIAEGFYAGNVAYLDQIRKVKHMMDPKRILNPDQLVKGV